MCAKRDWECTPERISDNDKKKIKIQLRATSVQLMPTFPSSVEEDGAAPVKA